MDRIEYVLALRAMIKRDPEGFASEERLAKIVDRVMDEVREVRDREPPQRESADRV